MNCPVCGTESPESVNYCPTCGTPLHPVPASQSQQFQPVGSVAQQSYVNSQAAYAEQPGEEVAGSHFGQPQPTMQQPLVQQPTMQQPVQPHFATQQYSQPMRPVAPPPAAGRQVNTAALGRKPVWPIVLIAVLLLVILVAALLLWHPWSTGAQDGTAVVGGEGNIVVTSVGGQGQPVDGQQPGVAVVGDSGTGTTAPAATAPTTDEQAYAQLSAAYDQFAGYNDRIGSVVDFFNTYYPSSADAASIQAQLDAASALQAELASQAATLNAIVLPEGSGLVQSLANMKTLNNDLTVRIGDLADALAAWLNGDVDGAGAALTRHNQNGVSIYKSEYESLYPNARP